MVVHNPSSPFAQLLQSRAFRVIVGIALVAFALAAALSWIPVVKTQGRVSQATTNVLRKEQAKELTAMLTRSGDTTLDSSADVILTPPGFYRLTNRTNEAAQYGADKYVVFVANEHVHAGELPKDFTPVLRIDGKSAYLPSDVIVIADSGHHRTSVLVYKDLPASMLSESHSYHMITPVCTGDSGSLEWDSPIDIPESAQAPSINPSMLLSLGAGLLAAISPCLLQLTAYYLPTLAGVSMDAMRDKSTLAKQERRRVMTTAILFVLGFTIPYTLGGAAIGGMGQVLAAQGVLNSNGPLAIGAGAFMIAIAGIVAYRSRAPLVCKLPMPAAMQRSKRLPLIETFVSGFAIATGCLACFGGAILAVLLVYTGLLGSWWLGGISMFAFSLGIAIPFLLAAYSLSWVMPVAQKLQRLAPAIGLVSAAVMLFFGVVMVTGNFHVLSGWIRQSLPIA